MLSILLSAGAPGSAAAAVHVVEVDDNGFHPVALQIQVDDEVQWLLTGGLLHTTTSGNLGAADGLWDGVVTALTPFSRAFPSEGIFPYSCTIHGSEGFIDVVLITDIEGSPASGAELPPDVTMEAAAPNPFNASTHFQYTVSRESRVFMSIHNILGRQIQPLINTRVSPGSYVATWNGLDDQGNDAPSGVYFARLQTSDALLTRNVILLR